jgi:hypothetical protein
MYGFKFFGALMPFPPFQEEEKEAILAEVAVSALHVDIGNHPSSSQTNS